MMFKVPLGAKSVIITSFASNVGERYTLITVNCMLNTTNRAHVPRRSFQLPGGSSCGFITDQSTDLVSIYMVFLGVIFSSA